MLVSAYSEIINIYITYNISFNGLSNSERKTANIFRVQGFM